MSHSLSHPPPAAASGDCVVARNLQVQLGKRTILHDLSFRIAPGRIVGLLGHNGAGKTTLMRALVGQLAVKGDLSVLGRQPAAAREALMGQVAYIPDVAILPRWARVSELITLMQGLHPQFSAQRAYELVRRTSVRPGDKVGKLSRGMVVQLHLALTAAIDAKLMVLDEPTLGLDVPSRKAFYELLLDEWCDGQRSVLISTHQVEEVEALLSDVLMLNEGRMVLDIALADLDSRFRAYTHDGASAEALAASHPLLRYRVPGGQASLWEGDAPEAVRVTAQPARPSLVELFMALTRQPEINRQHQDGPT